MSDEEVLDIGPRRLPRWLSALVIAVLALAAGWALTRINTNDGSGPAPLAATSPVPVPSASPTRGPFQQDEQLAYVYQRARDAEPAQDFVRTDTSAMSCALAPIGDSPKRRINGYVRATFPHMRIRDTAEVLDKFTGLCVLELRARDDTGTVLVIQVISPRQGEPPSAARTDHGGGSAAGTFTRYVSETTRDGWMVTAGASGPADAGPSQFALLTVARQRSLLW